MYALMGIVSKNGTNISKNLISMMQDLCGNEKSSSGLIVGDRIFDGRLNDLNLRAIEGTAGIGCVPLKKTQRATVYMDCTGELAAVYDGVIYNFKEKLSREHKLVRATDADAIIHLLEENYVGDLAFAGKKIFSKLEGGFAVAVTDGAEIIAARDRVGFRTLYYGEDEDHYAFATLKRALWRLKIPAVFGVPAGNMIHINRNQVDISNLFPKERFGVKININKADEAINQYQESLTKAAEKMLDGLERAAIFLSGGIDSGLLAKILKDKASKSGIELTGYTVGLEGSADLKFAQEIAKQIELPFKYKTVTAEDVARALPKVVEAVEERDYVQIETGLIPYLAAEMVAQDSIRVVFLGQGPDELWGGYPWYPRLLKEWGYAKLHEVMWEDLIRGDVETLARENKVAQMFDIEVRYPYLDVDVIKAAMSVAPQLKVLSDKDSLGKRIHRSLAKRLGLPTAMVERKKDAAQHGSGIHPVLVQIAKDNGFDDELVCRLNYNPLKISAEKLGSSSRYGYKYGDKDLWTLPSCVQLYFDYIAYNKGLLNETERTRISTILKNFEHSSAPASSQTGITNRI